MFPFTLPNIQKQIYLLSFFLTYLLFHLLTYSKEHSPFEKLICSQPIKKFPAFYGTPRFVTAFTGAHTCPYPKPHRSSLYPTSDFLKIHLNIILPSTPGSSKWSFSLRFPHQNTVYAYPLPTRATCSTYLILLDLVTRTILGEEYRSLSSSLYSLILSPVTPSLLGPNILLSTPFSNTLSLRSSLNVSDHIYQK